jgi:SAM-dependent methyltransferase
MFLPSPTSLVSALVDLATGRRPEARNRVKFWVLSPIYDGFYWLVPIDPHGAIAARLPPGTRRVLDLCTGTALVPAVVAAERPEALVVGLDISPEMLAAGQAKLAARGITNAPLVRADAGALPFADGSIDAVTVSFGLHELPRSVRRHALAEVRRVLRPGGSLIVADLDRPQRLGFLLDLYLRLGEPPSARDVLCGGLSRLLRQTGFTVEVDEAAGGASPMQLLVARPGRARRRAAG